VGAGKAGCSPHPERAGGEASEPWALPHSLEHRGEERFQLVLFSQKWDRLPVCGVPIHTHAAEVWSLLRICADVGAR